MCYASNESFYLLRTQCFVLHEGGKTADLKTFKTCTMLFAPIRSGLRKKRVWAASLPSPEDDKPPAAARPSRPRLGERQRSASQSWRQSPKHRTLTLQEEEDVEDEDKEEPAPLFRRRTSTRTSSLSSRGSQWRRSTLSILDSAIDVDDQQSDHEVQDVPRPGRKRPKRGPTATVTTVEPVVSPAAEEEDTGKRDKKKHKKRHRQPQQQDEAEEVVEASPLKKKTRKTKKSTQGPGWPIWPRIRIDSATS